MIAKVASHANMQQMHIFTDGSAHTQSKIGYGAYLAIHDPSLTSETVKRNVKVRGFKNTTSTRLELQTLVWALNDIANTTQLNGFIVTIYTDSQNIIGLPARQGRLEQSDYISSNNKILSNSTLYRDFFDLKSTLNFKLIKVNGHQPLNAKNAIDKLFSLVDKASRRALRTALSANQEAPTS